MNKNLTFGLYPQVCNHARTSDFTVNAKVSGTIPHIFCHACGWHKFRGQEYTRQEWDKFINSPNPKDPAYNIWIK